MAQASPSGLFIECYETRGNQGSAPLAKVSFGVEASSPSEDQDICLAPATTMPNDEVPAAAHGPGLSRGMLVVRKGSGGLLTPILCMSPGPRGMAGGGRRPYHGDFGGDILAVSQRWIIPSRS